MGGTAPSPSFTVSRNDRPIGAKTITIPAPCSLGATA
jgi:hypothetical protein